MKIGQSFVFIGKDFSDEHLKNFTHGDIYQIKQITALAETDIYGDHLAIIFENFEYGVLKIHFDKYFISLDKFRNDQISRLID